MSIPKDFEIRLEGLCDEFHHKLDAGLVFYRIKVGVLLDHISKCPICDEGARRIYGEVRELIYTDFSFLNKFLRFKSEDN